MSTFFILCAILLLALHAYRTYWTRRELPGAQQRVFAGELFHVGASFIARRHARAGSRKTIVCFPGFLEDMRYFEALYEDTDSELILVNNANYHSPYDQSRLVSLGWPVNPYAIGTIEHDGYLLSQVLEHLVSGDEVILHGHSRGGAVVLECGRQNPQLVSGGALQVSAILEAPVLPQARTVGRGSEPIPFRLICYFLPIVLGLGRNASVEKLLKQPMMQPCNDLKIDICRSIYTNPRSYSTCITNIKSIRNWQRAHDAQLYQSFDRVTVVVGAVDHVLDNRSMLLSAEAGRALNAGVTILQTQNTNHFPSLEQPHYLHTLTAT